MRNGRRRKRDMGEGMIEECRRRVREKAYQRNGRRRKIGKLHQRNGRHKRGMGEGAKEVWQEARKRKGVPEECRKAHRRNGRNARKKQGRMLVRGKEERGTGRWWEG